MLLAIHRLAILSGWPFKSMSEITNNVHNEPLGSYFHPNHYWSNWQLQVTDSGTYGEVTIITSLDVNGHKKKLAPDTKKNPSFRAHTCQWKTCEKHNHNHEVTQDVWPVAFFFGNNSNCGYNDPPWNPGFFKQETKGRDGGREWIIAYKPSSHPTSDINLWPPYKLVVDSSMPRFV